MEKASLPVTYGRRLRGELPLIAERHKVFVGVFVARLQNAHVLVDDRLALVREGVGQHAWR